MISGSVEEPRRSRRGKKNSAKIAALEKIRQAKSGIRPEFELKGVNDVYKLVDDDEYGDIVTKRREEDFVVDDDGCGYVDDGREIFDDDLEQPIQAAKRAKLDKQKKKKPDVQRPTSQPKNIKNMFLIAGPKKQSKEESLSLGEDGVLAEVLSGYNDITSPMPVRRKSKEMRGYGLKKSTPIHVSVIETIVLLLSMSQFVYVYGWLAVFVSVCLSRCCLLF
jgi:DNA polymerase alpha subunit A